MRRLVGVVVVVALIGGALGYRRGAPGREAESLLNETLDHAGLAGESFRLLPVATNSGFDCEGQPVSLYSQNLKMTVEALQHEKFAIRTADRLEQAKWEVRRFTPPDDGGISTEWEVEAIKDTNMVLAGFGPAGSVSIVVRLGGCHEFGDDFARVEVSQFP